MLLLTKTKDAEDSKFYFSETQTQERDKELKGTERRKKSKSHYQNPESRYSISNRTDLLEGRETLY